MLNKEYSLIDSLIFSDENKFSIDISEYLDDIYEYTNFIKKIKKILRKSSVKVIDSEVSLNSRTVIWNLKVKK